MTSAPLLAELLDVLRRDRIRSLHGLDEQGIRRFVGRVLSASECVSIAAAPPGLVPHDPKDDPVVLTAISGQADVLCTRDRHFFHTEVLAVCRRHGMRVMRDEEFLAELRLGPEGSA